MLEREVKYLLSITPNYTGTLSINSLNFVGNKFVYGITVRDKATNKVVRYLKCTATFAELNCTELRREDLFHLSLSQ